MRRRFEINNERLLPGVAICLTLSLAFLGGPQLGRLSIAHSAPVPIGAKAGDHTSKGTYLNPLDPTWAGHGKVQNCADPSIIYAQDKNWYAYCSSDRLNDNDHSIHYLPEVKSPDLIHWTYVGDVFSVPPNWVAGRPEYLWAPDIHYFNNKYYLYFTAPETQVGGSAIGVASSTSPTGPWVDSGGQVVEPHAPPCCPGDKMWAFDPAVAEQNGQKYIFYGSFYGGIQARKLSADGLHSDPASQVQIATDNKFEGTFIVNHAGYYYLFASSTDCCHGALTGYSVFTGRSKDILGPYVDRDGHSLLEARAGGTPVLSMNGNRFVGPGHNAVFTDFSGQDWFLYHAIDRNHPFLTGGSPNRRHLMMDPLDWVNGWPTVRGGRWASDTPQPAPAAQPGTTTKYKMKLATVDRPGQKIGSLSDDFKGSSLKRQWKWVRKPSAKRYGVGATGFHMDTQQADLYLDRNTASLLLEAAPRGNFMVETKVSLNVPVTGSSYNYAQADLLVYKNDDNYVKLDEYSNYDTRQTEFVKEVKQGKKANVDNGTSAVGPPGDWTWFRIVRTGRGKDEFYRAYTSVDGKTWDRGGVWTQRFGPKVRIGLAAMSAQGFTATFAYVHVYHLAK